MILKFEKRNFHYNKYPININNVDINKIIISSKVSFCRNCFYWIQRWWKIKQLWILLPKMSGYAKGFDEPNAFFCD